MSFIAELRKEIVEQWRTYRFLISRLCAGFLRYDLALLAKFTPEILKAIPGAAALCCPVPITVVDAFTQYIKNMDQFGILLALLITMGAVARKKKGHRGDDAGQAPLTRGFLALQIYRDCPDPVGLPGIGDGPCLLLHPVPVQPYRFGRLGSYGWAAARAVHGGGRLDPAVQHPGALAGCGGRVERGCIIALCHRRRGAIHGKVLPGALVDWGGSIMVGSPQPAWTALWVSLGIIVACLAAAWLIFRRQEL